MSFQTAAIVAGAAFLLSFLAGLVGGVPLFDILVRALVWGGVGFGGSLGIETLLRSLLPDLFVPVTAVEVEEGPVAGQSVDITLEDEGSVRGGGFVEEVDDEAPVARARASEARSVEASEPSEAPVAEVAPTVTAATEGDEEMPEIGSFLDAFKPESAEAAEGASAAPPEYGDYAASPSRSAASEVTVDGEVQDPAILAKAVQTVMKRDAQGN